MPTMSMTASGVKRTSLIPSPISANDPKRTFASRWPMHCGPPPGVIKPVVSLFQRINGAARNSARNRQALLKVFADAEWHYHVDQPRPV